MEFRDSIAEKFQQIQNNICRGLEDLDGKSKFQEDLWQRPGGGGGATRIIQGGKVLEKGGVNFSKVFGPIPDLIKKEFKTDAEEFFATGVSIVLHPNNPHVPIIHMNIRYFELPGTETYWFGGGIDLTPHYIVKDQAKQFHQTLKSVCDKFKPEAYQEYKTWADNYFFNPHRNETRGVGGIFFDQLKHTEQISKQDIEQFVLGVGNSFLNCYLPIANANKDLPFNEEEKQWQLLRRGRYVEFNLVYDRGTQFGLKTGGRIESILMSLPKLASWEYDFKPQKNSPEAQTLELLKKDIDWVA
ncbi:oxygen-dependent coproporphyrinogen oxidase [Luteibaculum oceani]|uniref:coproporphyrinogen oxidase n=1 Tax=Luteibaculum oceani TaxID=1294296 RepID=A0A5C6V9W3_9FLAO|nr:oxygen-dependent coproporphyrinogen oxidase [Luteibaculum oceani]TXC81987.1 oxygen-dependent coproporphyrinogen oxidase [Luteibaculum oceani]